MKTKIVYVVVSLNNDIYMEQAIVSAWSARHYNPDCHIEMVCDRDTFSTLELGVRAQYKSLFNDIHVRDFQPEQGMMERSRWLKTSLREIIEGDFLFLDTDTVVCADLSYVDDYNFDLGMVLDCNGEFYQCLFRDWIVSQMKLLYDLDASQEIQYFNSGVVFARDCPLTKEFFKRWNELWVHSLRNFNRMKDQQPLMKANIDMGHVVKELSGDLNCQVAASMRYLHTAHIVHFFNNYFCKCEDLTPFFNDIFLQVKKEGLSDSIKESILNCKSSFCSSSMLVNREVAMYLKQTWKKPNELEKKIKQSNSYRIVSFVWRRCPKMMHIIEKFLGALIRVAKLCK